MAQLNSFRDLALAQAGAAEQAHFGSPSFRVSGKIFAQLSKGDEVGLVKLSPGVQEWLLASHPAQCWSDPQWGRHGWTHVRWAAIEATLLRDLIEQSWEAAVRRKPSLRRKR
jgi:hypothetical protein